MGIIYVLYSLVVLVIELSKKSRAFGAMNHSEQCQELLDNFAFASSHFTLCTLQNARPVHICRLCIDQYNKVVEEHEKIIQIKENSTCTEKLINQDRLEVIENSFMYVNNLWSRGQCRNCFEGNSNILSNSTKEFIKLYFDTNQCLEDHYDQKNKTYNPDVCFLCSAQYYKMSKFYAALKETSGNGNVCMDIVDTVNATQHLWSNDLHCGETVMTFELPLIAISTTFIIIPIIFYICAWKFTKDRSSAVINQNRVSQRFREKWRSRSGSQVSN